jgi:hypothetical protein
MARSFIPSIVPNGQDRTVYPVINNFAYHDGPSMFARIGVMKALNSRVERTFNAPHKDTHWGKRKLKKDQWQLETDWVRRHHAIAIQRADHPLVSSSQPNAYRPAPLLAIRPARRAAVQVARASGCLEDLVWRRDNGLAHHHADIVWISFCRDQNTLLKKAQRLTGRDQRGISTDGFTFGGANRQ